jgi:uncharacterized protein
MSDAQAKQPEKPLSYLATIAWAIVAFLAGQFVGLVVLMLWQGATMYALIDAQYDGRLVTLFIFVSNLVSIAVLTLAVRLARANVAGYFGLTWPPQRDLIRGIAIVVALIALTDGALYLSGRALVTPFQLESYTSAVTEGWLPAMAFAAIIMAPAGEEIMFRGFLFRGFVRSERSLWPGIIVISLLWAMLHIQYDWTGILQIFVFGLVLGWIRFTSGSVLLTFLLHALFNFEGTMETVLYVKFFAQSL